MVCLLMRVSYGLGWPQTYHVREDELVTSDPPASTSRELGLPECCHTRFYVVLETEPPGCFLRAGPALTVELHLHPNMFLLKFKIQSC